MGFAGSRRPQRDHILTSIDIVATDQVLHEHLVERGDRLEVERIKTFDRREPCRPDAPFDQALFAVDKLQLRQSQQIFDVILTAFGSKLCLFLIFPLEARQAERLEIVIQQHLGWLRLHL